MKVVLLGTAAAEGIPGIFCNCETCQKALKLGGKDYKTRQQALIDNILIDFGADTYMHFLKAGRTLYDIENVLITHAHFDHFIPEEFYNRAYGMAYNFTSPKLTFYCNQAVYNRMQSNLDEGLLKNNYNIILVKDYISFEIEGHIITPMPAIHSSNEESHIYLLEKENKCVLYCLDTGIIKEDKMYNWLKENNKHIDLIIFDCTKGAKESNYYTHMSMSENNYMKEKFISFGICDTKTKYVCTHFSHNCKMNHCELEDAAKKYGLEIAFDNMEIIV